MFQCQLNFVMIPVLDIINRFENKRALLIVRLFRIGNNCTHFITCRLVPLFTKPLKHVNVMHHCGFLEHWNRQKSPSDKIFFWIFLQSIHQVDIKNCCQMLVRLFCLLQCSRNPQWHVSMYLFSDYTIQLLWAHICSQISWLCQKLVS